MAEKSAVWVRGTDLGARWATVTWSAIGDSDTAAAIRLDERPLDIVLQLAGTIASQEIALHGSNDGTNFAALNDLSGSAIALAAAGITGVQIAPLWFKPVTSGGSGSSSDVTLLFRFMD